MVNVKLDSKNSPCCFVVGWQQKIKQCRLDASRSRRMILVYDIYILHIHLLSVDNKQYQTVAAAALNDKTIVPIIMTTI